MLIRALLRLLVPEARVELARVSPEVFETSVSAIPPLGHVSAQYSAKVTVGDGVVFVTPTSERWRRGVTVGDGVVFATSKGERWRRGARHHVRFS